MSLMSREDMLRELELLPVWQLRQPLPTQVKAQTLPADVSVPSSNLPESPVHEVNEIEVSASELNPGEVSEIEVTLADTSAMHTMTEASAEAAVSLTEESMLMQADSTVQLEAPAIPESSVTASQAVPMRFLLCENGHYGFLMAADAAGTDAQAVEILLQNMLRAMQLHGRVDIIDNMENIFAAHTPKILLSMGEKPANQLFGKVLTVNDWRNLQQQEPLLYAEIPLIVTYHPAHLLAHTADKAHAWRDLCAALKLMQRL